jgi:hypothetical protein
MEVEFGNAGELFTNETGWFVGFREWAKNDVAKRGELRFMPREQRLHTFCVKWMSHPSGDDRGVVKPPSEGRTLSILVSEGGLFRIQFSEHSSFPADETSEFRLERHGDFVVWGPRLYHRWYVDAYCTILTIRWIPE